VIAKSGTYIQKRMLTSFDEIWIPDYPPNNSIAPQLSKPIKGENHHYIGLLSRLERHKIPVQRKYLVLLSGPEPSRSQLESMLLEALQGKNFLLVQGKPGNPRMSEIDDKIVSHLLQDQLSIEIAQSEIVVCRSGYTSIMDLLHLQKKAILIPTPGQTEQEYLAVEMQNRFSEIFTVVKEEEVGKFQW
jgi:hypothetical protein